jgi:hypothetical protein
LYQFIPVAIPEETDIPGSSSRRKVLKLVSGSSLATIGFAGTAAADSSPKKAPDDDDDDDDDDEEDSVLSDLIQEEKREVYKAAQSENSLVVLEGEELGVKETTSQTPRVQSHCPSGDGLHWNYVITQLAKAAEFEIKDCPDTCDWKVSVTVAGQTYEVVDGDECEAEHNISMGVTPLQIEGEVERELITAGPIPTTIIIYRFDRTITYYSPFSGWQTKEVDTTLSDEEPE